MDRLADTSLVAGERSDATDHCLAASPALQRSQRMHQVIFLPMTSGFMLKWVENNAIVAEPYWMKSVGHQSATGQLAETRAAVQPGPVLLLKRRRTLRISL